MGIRLRKILLYLGVVAVIVLSGCDAGISYDVVERKDKERAETAKRMPGYTNKREPSIDR